MTLDANDWWPDWSGQTCVIVAAGPSAKGAPLDAVRGRAKVIVINSSYLLAPWADVLYACDYRWWGINQGAPSFKGLKISRDRVAQIAYPDVKLVTAVLGKNEILTDRGRVGWGGNSGFQALNLAVQVGARKIALVGYDMTTANGVHWHGNHGRGLKNPTDQQIEKWRKVLDECAPQLTRLGVTVVNCSPTSALQAYPKQSLMEALGLEHVLP